MEISEVYTTFRGLYQDEIASMLTMAYAILDDNSIDEAIISEKNAKIAKLSALLYYPEITEEKITRIQDPDNEAHCWKEP